MSRIFPFKSFALIISTIIAMTILLSDSALAATSFIPVCERRAEVRDMITKAYGVDCSVLTPEFIKDEYRFAYLKLVNTTLTEIQPGDFQGIQIYELLIENNPYLTTISPEAFEGVVISNKIVIANNSALTQISSRAFENVTFRTDAWKEGVEIRSNPLLKVIQAQAFSSIKGIQKILVTENPSLEKIESLAFSNIRSNAPESFTEPTVSIEVSKNPSLKEILPQTFSDIHRIKTIKISDNVSLLTIAGHAIADSAFDRFDHSDEAMLEISGNTSLIRIEPQFIDKSYSSFSLTISNNNSLRTIVTNTLSEIPLRNLRISDNLSLESIATNAFTNLQLVGVVINQNANLKVLSPGFISNIKGIKSLEVSQNSSLETIEPGTFKTIQVHKEQESDYLKNMSYGPLPFDIVIRDNPNLKKIAKGAITDITNLNLLEISENATLQDIEAGFLENVVLDDSYGVPIIGIRFVLSKNPALAQLPINLFSSSLPFANLEISENNALISFEPRNIAVNFIVHGSVVISKNASLQIIKAGALDVDQPTLITIEGNTSLQGIEVGGISANFNKRTSFDNLLDGRLEIHSNLALTSLPVDFIKSSNLIEVSILRNGKITDFDVLNLQKMSPEVFEAEISFIQSMKRNYSQAQFKLISLLVYDGAPVELQDLFTGTGLAFENLSIWTYKPVLSIPANSFTMQKLGLYSPINNLDIHSLKVTGPIDSAAFTEVTKVYLPN